MVSRPLECLTCSAATLQSYVQILIRFFFFSYLWESFSQSLVTLGRMDDHSHLTLNTLVCYLTLSCS